MSTNKKVWTFSEMNTKIRSDIDMLEEDPDEQFIKKAEMIGYLNEGIDEAEAEIQKLNEDYFLTYDYVPLVEGEDTYDLPSNIYAQKIRRCIYKNGTTIYTMKRFRDLHKFEQIAFSEEYSDSEEYAYYLVNTSPDNVQMVISPPARETAVVPPLTPVSAPLKRWYIRNANRIPYEGEYTNPEDVLSSAVDASANTIAVDPLVTYVTGDKVKLSVTGSNTIPAGLTAGTIYYVIAISSTSIKLATTLANAQAGTAIDITSVGSGFFTITVAATDAIIDATVIDIPEFSIFIMEYAKANCLLKDGDPRMAQSVEKIEKQRKMMQDTLVEAQPDDDNVIQGDYSYYNEMS